MTERATEIGLGPLAMKFAGGDRAKKREWERTLHEAVRAGTLEARAQRVEAPRVVKADNPFSSRFKTIGETTFAGTSARVVAPIGREAPTPRHAVIYHYVTPAAVAAWLAKLPEEARKDIHASGWAWLGDAWPVVAVPADAVKPGSGQRLDNEYPPILGKIPPVASGRLAIKAAWQIECEEDRPATDEEVMAKLRAWGKSGAEPNHLMDCDKLPLGTPPAVVSAVRGGAIHWQTGKGKVKEFTLEACQKALEKWRKSRQ